MAQISTSNNRVKQSVVVPLKVEATSSETVEYLIYFFFGVIEVLLGFRLILKLSGANLSSGFVDFIYNFTGIMIMPFENIFPRAVSQGVVSSSVFEPSTIVALIVYGILAVGIVKLIRISSGEQQPE